MSTDAAAPDIPDKNWSNPFAPGTPLHQKFERIVSQHRDLIIIVDDANGARGTGKTVASLQLAAGMDQTEDGIIDEKVSMQPEAIREAYATQPKRSALVLDEGEVGASNRESMTKTNQALREIMSMGRVEEKYVVVNTPLKQFIDKDIRKLADVWMSMERKGLATVHFFDWERYNETLLTPKVQQLSFDDIDSGSELRDVYNSLTRDKRAKIRGEEGGGFITREEHREQIEKERKEVAKETRNEHIKAIADHPKFDVSQYDLADAFGVSQPTISDIVSDPME